MSADAPGPQPLPPGELREVLGERPDGLWLRWGVKDSFIRYLEAMDDSALRALHGAQDAGEGWRFPYQGHDVQGEAVLLRFAGELRLSAHGGALLVIFMQPHLRLSPAGVELSTVDLMRWPDTTAREIVGEGPAAPGRSPDGAALRYDVNLAQAAVETFNGVYPAGVPLAPVWLEKY